MAAHSAEHPSNLDRVRIATPCPISWEQLTGDNRVRFCDHCKLNVYNISELSRIEAESLIASTEGRLCARLFRRADGTVLTKDCPVGLRALRMRVSRRAAAVFAVIAGISSAVFGQQSSATDKTSCKPKARTTRMTTTLGQEAPLLSGTVMDASGSLISHAKISVTSLRTNVIKEATADDEGRFQLNSLMDGSYLVKISAEGFLPYLENLQLERNHVINLEVVLQPGMLGEVVLVEPPVFDFKRGTTIINEQMIRQLPIQK